MTETAEKKIGKYTLMRHIATGGMAEIWLAEQRGPGGFNKELVIKRILPHLADEGQMTQMFMDEARLVAQLTHRNIGQVYELGEHDGEYYIAMEFIDGFDLADLQEALQKRGTSLPIAYAAKIIADILAALDYAHNFTDRDGNPVGLIHRDVSPHNVLISNEGDVKLVDFGVAKAEQNSHKTETGAVKGKFAYMAPEQIENKKLDRRVDIFSVGTLFFELLTGRKPFGDDLKAVSMIISLDSPVPDPRDFRKDIPEPVAKIILGALTKDRDKRFSTAAEMEHEIHAYLRGAQEMVGTRELSVMVRQLRDMPASRPTEQLFGFEKQGVQRSEPRITKKEIDDKGGRLTQTPGREEYQTRKETPSTKGANLEVKKPRSNTLALKAESEGLSMGLVIGFVLLTLAVLAAFAVAGFLLISNAGPEPEGEDPAAAVVAEADGDGDDEAAEIDDDIDREALGEWSHSDGFVVSLGSQTPAELFSNGRKIGETPFQTRLRPGDYILELRADDERKIVQFEVEEDNPLQRYRFEF